MRSPTEEERDAALATAREKNRRYREANRERLIEKNRRYRDANREKVRETNRRYRERNLEKVRERDRLYYQAQKENAPDKVRVAHRRSRLKKYGLTEDQWCVIFDAQGRRCAICGSDDPRTSKGWATDHDHVTGAFRAILCWFCNTALGYVHDDPDRLRAMALYLEQHAGIRVAE